MKKKLSFLILVLVLMFSVVGCGKGSDKSYYCGTFHADDDWGGQRLVVMKNHTFDWYAAPPNGQFDKYGEGTWKELDEGRVEITFNNGAIHYLAFVDDDSFKTQHPTGSPAYDTFGGVFVRE